MNLSLTGALAVLLLVALSSVEADRPVTPTLITTSEKLGLNQLIGPESIIFDDEGFLYVSVSDGSIRKVNPITFNSTVYTYTRPNLADRSRCGQPGNATAEAICGRPLGIKFDRRFNMYVCDAYYGLLFVPRKNPFNVTVLANSSNGVKFGFTNALIINKAEDTIYLTDTSPTDSRFAFTKVFLEAKPQGRLVRYCIRTGTTTTLLGDLRFGNGLAFNKHETEIIINETSLKRVRRYYLSGPYAGQNNLFNPNIGGYPDNVEYDDKSGFFLIGCYSQADPATDAIIANNTNTPTSPPPTNATAPAPGYIVALNHRGALKRILYDPTGANVARASEAKRKGPYIYVGSVVNPYLTRIPASLLRKNASKK